MTLKLRLSHEPNFGRTREMAKARERRGGVTRQADPDHTDGIPLNCPLSGFGVGRPCETGC